MKSTLVTLLITTLIAFATALEANTAVYIDYNPHQKCLDKCTKTVKPLIKGQTSCTRPFRSKISSLEVQACNNGEESAMRDACDATCAVIPGTGSNANEMKKFEYHKDSPIQACKKHKKYGIERYQSCRKAYIKGRDVLSKFVSSVVLEHDTVEGVIKFVQLPSDEVSSNNDNEGYSGGATIADKEADEQIYSEIENVEASGLAASVQERSNIMKEEPTVLKVLSDHESPSVNSFKRIGVASHVDQEIHDQLESEEENDESLGLNALRENRSDIVEREAVKEFNVSKLFSSDGINSSREASHPDEEKGGESRSKMEMTKLLEARAPVEESKNFLDYDPCLTDYSGLMKRIEFNGTYCAKTDYHTPPTIFEACQDGANDVLANVCPSLCRKFPESNKAENVSKRITSASEACSKHKEFEQQFMSCRAGCVENVRSLTVSIDSTFLEEGPVEESIQSSPDEELSSANIHSSKAVTYDQGMNEHFQIVSNRAFLEETYEFIVEDEEVPDVELAEMKSVDQEQPTHDNIYSPKVVINFHLDKDWIILGKADTFNELEAVALTQVSRWRLISLQGTREKFKSKHCLAFHGVSMWEGSTVLSKQFAAERPKSNRFNILRRTIEPVLVDVVPSRHRCGNRLCDVKKAECINISMTCEWIKDINEEGSSIDDHPAILFRLHEVCAHMTCQYRDGCRPWHASVSPWYENHTGGPDAMSVSFLYFHVGNAQTKAAPLFVDTGPVDDISFITSACWLKSIMSLNQWQHPSSVQNDERKREQLMQQLDESMIELSLHRSMCSKDTIYSYNSRIGIECRGMSSTISSGIGRLHYNVESLTDKGWIRDIEAHQVAISRTKARIEVTCKDGSKVHFISVLWIEHDAINLRLLVPLLHPQDPDEPCNQIENDVVCRQDAISLSGYFSSCLIEKVEDAIDLINLEHLHSISSWYLSHEVMIEMNFQRQQVLFCHTHIYVELPLVQARRADETTRLKGSIKMILNPSVYPRNAMVHIHPGSEDNPSLFWMIIRLCSCQNHCIWSVNLEYLDAHLARLQTDRDCSEEVEVYPLGAWHLTQFGRQACDDCTETEMNWQQNFAISAEPESISQVFGVSFLWPAGLMHIEQQLSDNDEPGKKSSDVWDITSLGSLNCTRLQSVSSDAIWLCIRSSLPSHHVRMSLDDRSIVSTMNQYCMLFCRNAIDTGPSLIFVHPSLIVSFFFIVVYCHRHLRKRLSSLCLDVAAYDHNFQASQDSTMLLELRQQVARKCCFFVDMCFRDESIQAVSNDPALSKIQSSGQHPNLDAFYCLQFIYRPSGNCKRRSYQSALLLYSFGTRKLSPL